MTERRVAVRDWSGVLFWAAAVGLLALGAGMRLGVLPAVPLFEWDTRGWLEPALRWVGGGEFRESCEREWLYAAMLAACLKFGGSFGTVVWVQWALGLAGGVVLWLAWRTWASLLPGGSWVQWPAGLLGLLALAAYVLNPNVIAFEMSLRPEAVLGVVVLTAMWCATGFAKARWGGGRRAHEWAFGVPLPLLAGAIATLKPSWALSLPVIVLPLFLSLFCARRDVPARLSLIAVGGALAWCLLVLPERVWFVRSLEPRVVLPMTLLTIHADAVLPALDAERRDPATAAQRRALLDQALPVLEADLEASRHVPIYYHKLGFDPDYIMYRARLFPFLEHQQGLSKAEIVAFCYAGFREAWLREPWRMLAKVFGQLGYVAFPDGRTYSKKRVELDELTEGSIEVAGAAPGPGFGPRAQELYTAYHASAVEAAGLRRTIHAWRPLDRFLRERVPPALFVGLVGVVMAGAALGWRRLHGLRVPAVLVLFYFAVPAGNALTVALVHALDNDRYRMSYGNVLFFAICATAALAIALAGCLARRPSA